MFVMKLEKKNKRSAFDHVDHGIPSIDINHHRSIQKVDRNKKSKGLRPKLRFKALLSYWRSKRIVSLVMFLKIVAISAFIF